MEKIEIEQSAQEMYNLTVDEAHTYYVGDGQWLVHNVCIIDYKSPNNINFSQRTAGRGGRYGPLYKSMAENGWDGPPIDVVQNPKGGLTSIDNTRLAIARQLGLDNIPVRIHTWDDPLPSSMIGRFGNSSTWGEALTYRTSSQYPPLPPYGTHDMPRLPGQ